MKLDRERERAMEHLIGWSMLIGVLVAGAIVLGGGVLYLAQHAGEPVQYHVFQGTHAEFDSVGGVTTAMFGGSHRAWVQLGLMMLVALQLVRVILAGALFTRERDWIYVVLTTFVLGVLVYGFVG